MRIWYVYQHNRTDCRDDNVIKVRAKSRSHAREIAERQTRSNYRLGRIYSAAEFRADWPGWWSLMKSSPASTACAEY